MNEKPTGEKPAPVWIKGPRLRARWDMSNSSFYQKLKDGAIPKPFYPFNDAIPYWSMDEIVAFEEAARNRKSPGGKS